VFGFLSLWSDRSILVLSLRVSELARLLLLGSFEEELAVMADVRAYYHVAYKVSLAHHLQFNALITSSSASLTIFLSESSTLSIIPSTTASIEELFRCEKVVSDIALYRYSL
jgi:hypothetical protein